VGVMMDSFAVLITLFFVVVVLYSVGITYVVKVLRRLEDKVKVLEKV
jgi:hypothetical protein